MWGLLANIAATRGCSWANLASIVVKLGCIVARWECTWVMLVNILGWMENRKDWLASSWG